MRDTAGNKHIELELQRFQVLIVVLDDRLCVEILQAFDTEELIRRALIFTDFLLNDTLEKRVSIHQCSLSNGRIAV